MKAPRVGFFVLLLLLALVRCVAGDGWEQVWRNDHAKARAAFSAALTANPREAQALCGRALLNEAEGLEAEALADWLRFYQVAPGGWQAMAYWSHVVRLAEHTGRYTALDAAATAVLAAKTAPPELRASARLALAAAAQRQGRVADADAVYAKMGYLRQWRVIGPFDNVSHSGFAKAFPPEAELDFTKSYPGIDNQPVSWQPLRLVTREGRCDLGLCLGDDSEPAINDAAAVCYAATAVYVPTAQPVRLCLVPAGASKVFLNGRLMFSDDKYRYVQPLVADPFSVPATLQPGWNTVLVKVAGTEYLTPAFALRFTTLAGEDLAGLKVEPSQVKNSAVTASTAEHFRVVPDWLNDGYPRSATAAFLLKQPVNSEIALALGEEYRRTYDEEAAIGVLREAVAKAPDASWLRWALSRALDQDGQSDEARAERDAARKANPRLVEAALDDLREQEETLGETEYCKRLKAVRAQFPNSPAVAWALADAYHEAEMESEAITTGQAALKLAPGPENQERLAMVYGFAGRGTEGLNLLTDALKQYPNNITLLERRAKMLHARSRTPEAIVLYQRLLQFDASCPRYRNALAGCYEARGDKAQAAAQLGIVHAQCPNDASVTARLAELKRELGSKAEAIALYRDAVRRDPARVNWREKLQTLLGESSPLALVPETPVEPILKEAKAMKAPPATSAVVLLDECRTLLYPDFASDTRRHVIVKVFDEAGAEHFNQIRFEHFTAGSEATAEKARVLKADGTIEDVTEEAESGGVAFPSLAAGDILDVVYRVADAHRGALARQFWMDWKFAESETPVKCSRLVCITPPAVTLHPQAHGAVPPPVEKQVKGWRVQEWRMTEVPAERGEEYGTPYVDHGVWVDLSTIPSWEEIVRWYADLAGPRCQPDAAIRAKATELTKDAKTEAEKVRAIVTFVARKIKYQSGPFRVSQYIPTEGKKVLREHYGDCKDKAALVCALCAAVGIPAEMVLLNPRDDGLTPFLPSPRFSHAINCLHTADGPLWVDTTADQMRFGLLPLPDQGVPALVIAPATAVMAQTPILPAESNAATAECNIVLEADGKMTGTMDLHFAGNWGWMLRAAIAQVPEGKQDTVLRALAGQYLKSVVYDSGAIDALADIDQPLNVRLNFHADDFLTPAGDYLFVQHLTPPDARTETLLQDPKRTQDLEMPSAYGLKRSITRVTLPAGYRPDGLKPTVELTTPWSTFRATAHLDGATLTLDRTIATPLLRIPRADFPQYREFIRAMEAELKRSLVLKKEGGEGHQAQPVPEGDARK